MHNIVSLVRSHWIIYFKMVKTVDFISVKKKEKQQP